MLRNSPYEIEKSPVSHQTAETEGDESGNRAAGRYLSWILEKEMEHFRLDMASVEGSVSAADKIKPKGDHRCKFLHLHAGVVDHVAHDDLGGDENNEETGDRDQKSLLNID